MPDQQITHTFYDILKDFQPALAAAIALAAATLAYRGAMAKVEFDRRSSERERIRHKLGLYMRLRYRASRVKWIADNFQEEVQKQLADKSQSPRMGKERHKFLAETSSRA